jgi:hypothetical protein
VFHVAAHGALWQAHACRKYFMCLLNTGQGLRLRLCFATVGFIVNAGLPSIPQGKVMPTSVCGDIVWRM